jgi:hypothetical protein
MTEVIGLWGQTKCIGSESPSIRIVAATRFPQDEGIVVAVEAESLLNAAGYRNSRIAAWNSKAVREYPHLSSTVFDLKNAISHRAE